MKGNLTVDYLKVIIQVNRIKNNVVTTENVNLATEAYGTDVEEIKVKTTRGSPTPAVSNIVYTSNELI